jgi:hypothetical protein
MTVYRSVDRQGSGMNQSSVVFSMAAVVGLSTASRAAGQQRAIEVDLARLAAGHGLQVFNRSVTSLGDSARKGLRLSESPGNGVAYVQGVDFANGAIEADIRGKDVQQLSFVGVAFHGVDSTTYEAIYFRPFNFQATDSVRRAHAVQYVSHPTYTWQKLRAEHPGVYEQPVKPVPDPNGWFHVRMVVAGSQVRVFVNDATEASLVVTRLSERTKGLVGLWVGNNSGGDFANLRIRPE